MNALFLSSDALVSAIDRFVAATRPRDWTECTVHFVISGCDQTCNLDAGRVQRCKHRFHNFSTLGMPPTS